MDGLSYEPKLGPAAAHRAITKQYGARPENTIIVSPDNASRRAIVVAMAREMDCITVTGANS